MSAAADEVERELGPIDVLIANAGIGPTRDAADIERRGSCEGFQRQRRWRREQRGGRRAGNGQARQRASGRDLESCSLSWLAEVGGVLRQQSCGFGVLRKPATRSGAERHRRNDHSSGFHQDAADCRPRSADAIPDGAG